MKTKLKFQRLLEYIYLQALNDFKKYFETKSFQVRPADKLKVLRFYNYNNSYKTRGEVNLFFFSVFNTSHLFTFFSDELHL